MENKVEEKPVFIHQSLSALLKIVTFFTIVGLALLAVMPRLTSALDLGIVATVNEDIITQFDLSNRIGLTLISTRTEDTLENRQKVAMAVLRNLIDERLMLATAKNENITATESEVNGELRALSQRNKLSLDEMAAFFAQRNIDIMALADQFRAQIAWRKFVKRKLSRQIQVSDTEITSERQRLARIQDKTQRRIFEILIPLENPEQEPQIRQGVNRLHQQLLAGADFVAVARDFSKSHNASQGGDMGWLYEGQMRAQLWSAILPLKKGEITAPIRSLRGFHIFKVAGIRAQKSDETDIKVTWLQVTLPEQAEDEAETRADLVNQIRTDFNACALPNSEPYTKMTTRQYQNLTMGQLSPLIAATLKGLEVGEVSEAVALNDALNVLGLCQKTEKTANLPSTGEIKNRIGNQRLEILANRYLRDIRNAAFIDIRQ